MRHVLFDIRQAPHGPAVRTQADEANAMNYYNEIDPKAAAWLRELINRDLIAPGVVDERSIEDVVPSDLKGFTQCHFFAGIGGWSYALRLAGWPDDKPVWTGSCPCQPFSTAGKGTGFNDERHLWPAWFHLIKQCNPSAVYGEQVANASEWLELVQGDLEGVGYTFAAIPIEAASVGADHLRDRLWFFADSDSIRQSRSWKYSAPISAEAHPHREADRFVHAFRQNALPFLCGGHDGVSESLDLLRGYGNAINPYAAKAFIEATQEALMDLAGLQITEAA